MIYRAKPCGCVKGHGSINNVWRSFEEFCWAVDCQKTSR